MTAAWTVKDSNGELLHRFNCASRLELGRKVVPARYDAFRLHVSSSYRELFERALKQVLERENWQIVRVRPSGSSRRAEKHALAQHGDGHALAESH